MSGDFYASCYFCDTEQFYLQIIAESIWLYVLIIHWIVTSILPWCSFLTEVKFPSLFSKLSLRCVLNLIKLQIEFPILLLKFKYFKVIIISHTIGFALD